MHIMARRLIFRNRVSRVCAISGTDFSQWSRLTQRESFRKARRILPGSHVPKSIRTMSSSFFNSQQRISVILVANSGAENRRRCRC